MSVAARRVTVGPDGRRYRWDEMDAVYGLHILVRNRGASSVDLGGPGVTSGAGFELAAGDSVELGLSGSDELWAISLAAVRVDVLGIGLGV